MKQFWICFGLMVAAVGWAQQEAPVYHSPQTGLAFGYPADWQLTAAKDSAKFVLPLKGTAPGKLEVFSVLFARETELWLEIQKKVAGEMHRTVEKQWQEEILGVPLLLTKLTFKQNGEEMTALQGLIYSATPRKMLFLLTTPSLSYDDAEYQLRQALLSIKTETGGLPTAEDPNAPPSTQATKTKPESTKKVTAIPAKEVKLNPSELTALSLPYGTETRTLSYPKSWIAEQKDGKAILRTADVPGQIEVEIIPLAEGTDPRRLLFKASDVSGKEFTKIDKRFDVDGKDTPVAKLYYVMRQGSTTVASLATCDAIGVCGDMIWVLRYRSEGQPQKVSEFKQIEALLNALSIKP